VSAPAYRHSVTEDCRPEFCHVCGLPVDAGFFDDARIRDAPQNPGEEVELARYQMPPQYCGVLLHFAQYAEPTESQGKEVFETPGYEWSILCDQQPRAPYLPSTVIRNPWGRESYPVRLRLEDGCLVRLVVRCLASAGERIELAKVGGRLVGRYWYNSIYGHREMR
jgi:hypothetical protein